MNIPVSTPTSCKVKTKQCEKQHNLKTIKDERYRGLAASIVPRNTSAQLVRNFLPLQSFLTALIVQNVAMYLRGVIV